jgi:hypothetical protein
MGPHNVGYSSLISHLEAVSIQPDHTKVKNFAMPLQSKPDSHAFTVMSPEEFEVIHLPEIFAEGMLLLTPQDYLDSVSEKAGVFKELQERIAL